MSEDNTNMEDIFPTSTSAITHPLMIDTTLTISTDMDITPDYDTPFIWPTTPDFTDFDPSKYLLPGEQPEWNADSTFSTSDDTTTADEEDADWAEWNECLQQLVPKDLEDDAPDELRVETDTGTGNATGIDIAEWMREIAEPSGSGSSTPTQVTQSINTRRRRVAPSNTSTTPRLLSAPKKLQRFDSLFSERSFSLALPEPSLGDPLSFAKPYRHSPAQLSGLGQEEEQEEFEPRGMVEV